MRLFDRYDKIRHLLFFIERSNKNPSKNVIERLAVCALIEIIEFTLIDISFERFDAERQKKEEELEQQRAREFNKSWANPLRGCEFTYRQYEQPEQLAFDYSWADRWHNGNRVSHF